MNMEQTTTMIAKAIAKAFVESKRDLQNRRINLNVVPLEPHEMKRVEYDLENHFFEMVVAYRDLLSEAQYQSLCTKVEIDAGQRFCYRP